MVTFSNHCFKSSGWIQRRKLITREASRPLSVGTSNKSNARAYCFVIAAIGQSSVSLSASMRHVTQSARQVDSERISEHLSKSKTLLKKVATSRSTISPSRIWKTKSARA